MLNPLNRVNRVRKRAVASLVVGGLVGGSLLAASATTASAAAVEPVVTDLLCSELVRPIDPNATPETVRLFQNMHYRAGEFMMYGHQEDQASNSVNRLGQSNPSHAYGVSATYQRVGMYPGIFGWDIGHIELKNDNDDWGSAAGTGRPAAYSNGNVNAGTGSTSPKFVYTGRGIDGITVADMAEWIREGASWNGINTISIHSLNPVTYGVYNYNLYKPGRWPGHSEGTATSMVLPGGELNARYQSWLDAYIDFNELLKDDEGNYIPIIIRPYHEHSGDWFWWGIDDMERDWRPAAVDEFVELWKYTVDYWRDNGVHNFLYAISPDRSRMGEPSYFISDLVDNPELKQLIDKYIDLRFTGSSNASVRTVAHTRLSAYYVEANAEGFDENSPRWEETIALNFQAVPLDLNQATGAVQNNVRAEFDTWFVRDPATGTSKFEDYFWSKYLEGFPGSDYVDVYGLDNYWENGNGHSYNPYRNATAKLKELFVASINTVAKHAREDGKLVALTEGSFTGAELINRIVNNGADSFGDKYPYAKYTSYAMTWWGNINDSTLIQAAQHPGFRWVTDAERQPIENAVPNWYTEEVGCTADGTFDALRLLVSRFSSNPEVTQGLVDKANAAENTKRANVRANVMVAFKAQVAAQVGKALTAEQAEVLSALANSLS